MNPLAEFLPGEFPVWDNHACPPMDPDKLDCLVPVLRRYRAAGVNVLSLNCGYGEMNLQQHLSLLAALREMILQYPDEFLLVNNVNDVEIAFKLGKTAIVFDVEGAAPLDELDMAPDLFHELGVRWILLAYNRRNRFASGIHDEDCGLSDDGRSLVHRLQKAGIVVCVSHTSPKSAIEAISIATKPVIFSHSNPLALCPHPRNITDDLIKACAESGGVVGINGLELFLGEGGASAERVAEHIDYVAHLVGTEHVGLGLDYVFDLDELEREKAMMTGTFPPGSGYERPTVCTPPESIRAIAANLALKGWTKSDLAKALGGNWLRVAKACWRA